MKTGRNWLQMLMPAMMLLFLCFATLSHAQSDDGYYDDPNAGASDYSDEALIAPEQDIDYNTFHDELSPYGQWTTYPGYGNVWICNISNFRPYNTGGHWAYTRFGWTWASDYKWGWAPFHYGRWAYDVAYGWMWIPGYTWGPAWVSWRNGGGYYGWAPLSPGLSVGINIGINIPAANWCFLPNRYMGYGSIRSHYINPSRNTTIIHQTTIINTTNVFNNNRYFAGPDRRDVERYSGRRISQQNIYVSNRREAGRQNRNGIHMYNPNAGRTSGNNRIQRNDRAINRSNPSQDHVRQRQFRGQPMQNAPSDNRINRQPNNIQRGDANNNRLQNEQQRRQRVQDMQNRMQRQQQINQQRQQMYNNRNQQMQQQRREIEQQPQNRQRQQMFQQRNQQFQQRNRQLEQRT